MPSRVVAIWYKRMIFVCRIVSFHCLVAASGTGERHCIWQGAHVIDCVVLAVGLIVHCLDNVYLRRGFATGL